MDEFSSHLRKTSQICLIIIVVCIALWVFIADWRQYFAGFVLGTAVSLLNAYYTAWKIRQLSDVALQASEHQPRKKVNLGFLTRASTSLLAVLVSIKAADIAFSTTLASLFIAQIVSISVGVVTNMRNKGGR
jgi:ATP synthase protein I